MQNSFQIFLKQVPALRLLIGFIVGILLEEYLKINLTVFFIILSFSFLFFLGFQFFSIASKYRYQWVLGIAIFFIMMSLGSIVHYFNNVSHNSKWYGHHESIQFYEAVITESLDEKPKTFKTTAKIISVKTQNKWQKTDGKILLYLRKDSLPKNLSIGSIIVFKKHLQEISNAGNPGEFDYKTYAQRNNFFHQIFLNADEYNVLERKENLFINTFFFHLREKVINIIDKNIEEKDERAVAKALLIGYRKDIDRDLYQAFTSTGIVHIIAISGMHLAMIYGALLFLFKKWRRNKSGKFLSGIIMLAVIWMFTILAGSVPSITRAAVMFSFIIVGEMLQRRTNIYNSLAASAFVLLLYNTYTLWDVGFLLSYSAVLSIVIFQRPIANLLFINNKILKSIWEIVSVTLSAQILTLPFILYYFHQFPNLFIISNLVAVPLSGFILYLEVILMIVSFIPFVAKFMGIIIEYLISIFNRFILHINQLPFALSKDIPINFVQTMLLFVLIISVYWFIKNKQKYWLFAAIISLGIFFSIYIAETNAAKLQQKIVIYNTSQNLIIDFFDGRKVVTLAKNEVEKNATTMQYVLQPSHYFFLAKEVKQLQNLSFQFPKIQYQSTKMWVLNNQTQLPENISEEIRVIILDDNPTFNWVSLQKIFPNATVVAANTNSLWKTQEWKKQSKTVHLRFHSTALDGAFVMNID